MNWQLLPWGFSMVRRLEKSLILIIFLYFNWFQYVFGIRQSILYVAALTLAVLIGFDICLKKRIVIFKSLSIVKTYIIFGSYALLTGLFIATDRVFMLTALLQFFEYVYICYTIYYISRTEASMEWILKVFYITALICGLQTLFFGEVRRSASLFVTTIGETNNPNTLGILMVFGIIAVLFDFESFQNQFLLKMSSIALFSYIVILTGSRKSFLAMVIILVFWLINYFTYTKFNKNNIQFIGFKGLFRKLVIILGVVAALTYVSGGAFSESSMMTKLLQLFTHGGLSESERIPLYLQAFAFFKQYPLFGIGFRQYEVLYFGHIYSHSTYAEILSCTGIVGTLIFFLPIVILLLKLVVSSFIYKNESCYKYRIILLVLLTELFIAGTQIVIYDLSHMTLITYLFWEFRRLENIKCHNVVNLPSDKITVSSTRRGVDV